MKQIIAFRRQRVYVSGNKENNNPITEDYLKELITISEELKGLGYILSEEAIKGLSEEDLRDIHTEIVKNQEWRKDRGDYTILYPGFPQQVIGMSDLELWENARKIYDKEISIDDFVSEFYTDEEIKDLEKDWDDELKTLKPMTEEDLMKIPQDICSSGFSIGQDQKDELEWFIKNYPDLQLPERISFKETLCLVMSLKESYVPQDINDILRYSIYVMGGELHLPHVPKEIQSSSWRRSEKTKNPEWRNLKSLPRSERRHILGMIDALVEKKGLRFTIPDAKGTRFYGSWVLLNERLHSGEYKSKFPHAYEFFDTLLDSRKNSKYKTWNSKVQEMYDTGKDLKDICKFISGHPGELVRRLDSLIRRGLKESKEGEVFDIFLTTPGMVNKTLLELLSYYDKAKVGAPRMIKVPGSSTMTRIQDKEVIDSGVIDVIQEFIQRKILINIDTRIKEKDLEGKYVVLDPEIRKIPIPKDMRDTASYIPRGTTFEIPEDKNIVAFFVQWIQEKGKNEDLDLHGYLCGEDGHGRNIGWNTGLRDESLGAIHSGDVLDKPGKCQETIVFDIPKCLESSYRYVVGDICNFKGRKFNTLPCHFGYTYVADMSSVRKNSITRNPEHIQDLGKSESSNLVTFLIDLKERSIMFLEVDMNHIPTFNSGSAQYYTNLIKYFTAPQSFTSYEIMEQHYKSRGAVILPEMPKEEIGEVMEIVEVWTAQDVAKDYVKVLGMIGE